jgi:hypothetical protein
MRISGDRHFAALFCLDDPPEASGKLRRSAGFLRCAKPPMRGFGQSRPYRLLPQEPSKRIGFLFQGFGELAKLGNPSLIGLLLGLFPVIARSHAQLRRPDVIRHLMLPCSPTALIEAPLVRVQRFAHAAGSLLP